MIETCLVWSWSKLPEVVLIMIRLNKLNMAAESGEEGSQSNLNKRECCPNWYYEETKFLVQIWAGKEIQHQLSTMNRKQNIWDNISQKLEANSFKRTGAVKMHTLCIRGWNVFETHKWCEQCFFKHVYQKRVSVFSRNMFRADVNTTSVIYHLLEYITTDIDLILILILIWYWFSDYKLRLEWPRKFIWDQWPPAGPPPKIEVWMSGRRTLPVLQGLDPPLIYTF